MATRQTIEQLNKYTVRLEALNKQMAQLNKESVEYKQLLDKKTKLLSKAAAESEKLAKETSKLQNQLGNNREVIDASSQAQERYAKATAVSTANTDKQSKATRRSTTTFGSALKTVATYLGAYRLLNFAIQAFTELTVGSVREAIKFQAALANLSAVAGVAGDDLKQLSENALEVAKATVFTAEEIVNLQTELSKLGFSAQQVVDATQAVAFTAQALGAPLDTTASQIGKVINQFDLLAQQAEYVGDVMVTSINESALSFDSFGTAIQYVGPIARNLGLSFEQTAAAMAVLADNGFTASRIGTGLRGIFTELGKTSADVEKSLKALAEQNISLSEAVDLVGKRNAAQLITLLDNIDAIDELNDKYYENERATIAAAKQNVSFRGQVKLLSAAFKEWQIGIGDVIAESSVLLGIMDLFFPSAGSAARSFVTLSKVSEESFQNVTKQVIDGADAFTSSLELMVEAGEITQEQFDELRNAGIDKVLGDTDTAYKRFRKSIGLTSEGTLALQNKIRGLMDTLKGNAEETLKSEAVTIGAAAANDMYKDSVSAVTDEFLKGKNVNEEVNRLNEEITATLDGVNKKLENREDLSELMVIALETEKSTLESLRTQLINSSMTEEEIANARTQRVKKERSDLNERIKLIKQNTKDEIEAINDAAKVADLGAKSAEERARIEEQRQQDVSAAYDKEANSIGVLSASYQENIDYIEEMAIKSDKLAEILNGDVVQDADKALKEYNKEFKELSDQYKDGEISLSEYTSATDDLRESYDDYIDTLIENNNLSEEAIDVLNYFRESFSLMSLVVRDKSLEASQSIEEFLNKLKDPENLRDFIKGYAEQFADSTTQVLQEFNDTQLENTKNSLESQLEEVKNRYEVEEDILRSSLDNQLITENQYRAKQKELRQAQLRDENDLNKQIFEAEQRQEKNDIRINTAAAIAEAVINAYTTYANPLVASAVAAGYSAIIGAQGALQISAVNQREFFPVRFAEGGLVNGPSHEQGGVPFTVQGQGGYEMEGGEFIVNREATARNYDLLRRINDSTKRTPTMGSMKFANGGLIGMQTQESVDYLKAIAEATMTTAISSSKPVRAYVTQKDLRSNENERRLKDRNDRL